MPAVSEYVQGKIRCPRSRRPLLLRGDRLITEDGGRSYPVLEGGIPDLFVASTGSEQARVEEANIQFHNRHSEDYDRLTVRPDGDYAEVTRVLEELKAVHGKAEELLDAGCGSGVILRRGAPLFRHVLGIDVSTAMLRRSLSIHRDLARASVFALPLDDASVDGIAGYSLLHHLHDPAEAFVEFHRVLRPGGFLYTDNDSNKAFHDRFGWWLRIRRAAKEKRSRTAGDEALEKTAECHHDTGLDPDALAERLRKAGFSKVEIRHAHPPRPDEFTRLLMELERTATSPSLRYYFRLVAWK